MGKIVVITAGKGGCGKTLLTAALGSTLADLGKKVCLLDACLGMRSLDLALNMQDRVVFDLYDLSEEICGVEQALLSVRDRLSMVAAPQQDLPGGFGEKQFARVIERLKSRFDYLLVDTPGALSAITLLAVRHADEAVLVTLPCTAGERNTERAASILREQTDIPLHLLMNCCPKPRSGESEIFDPEAISAYLDLPLLGAVPLHEAAFATCLPWTQAGAWPEKVQSAVREAALRLDGKSIPLKAWKERRFPWRF